MANGWLGGGALVDGLKANGRQRRDSAVTSSSLINADVGDVRRCWSLYIFELKTRECRVMSSLMSLLSFEGVQSFNELLGDCAKKDEQGASRCLPLSKEATQVRWHV